jgi:predicted RNA-binding Zn-ribbon protein involved in translation (DUF1610 family)
MEETKSIKQAICKKCDTLVELETNEIQLGKFICPECGEENILPSEFNVQNKEKALLINDTYAECVHCGNPKQIDEMEVLSKSFKCPDCGMTNELEIKPEFSAELYDDNTVKCENCGSELELEPEEILAKMFYCSECERINSIVDKKTYTRLRENNESKCISCDRKLILEKEEIDRKMFFCPRCGIENYLE